MSVSPDDTIMRCSELLILVLLLNVAHCLETGGLDGEPLVEITHNVTAVLGEVVYLGCRYLGQSEILNAKWIRQINSKVKSKGLSGFLNGQPFSRNDFSEPDSVTNLTVKMTVSSVDVGGEYICEFESEEGYFSDQAFVTVVARPDVDVQVKALTINGTHFQSVSCSAIGGLPTSQISWLINGVTPAEPFLAVSENNITAHSNGTFTQTSILHFPTHLQDEDSVTCDVQHPTLPNPKLTTVRVETFVKPNVTVKTEMIQREGSEFWVVSCVSSGGRPDTDISLALNDGEELQSENRSDSDVETRSVLLPVTAYGGHNVTCVFDHPKFSHGESRLVTLPSLSLTGVQLLDSEQKMNSDTFGGPENVELQEEQSDVVIGLVVTGNVPRYNVTCKKDDGPLPVDVELIGSNLTVGGPVRQQHAGLYECVVSYYHLQVALQLNITVQPSVVHSVLPTVRVDVQTKGGHSVIECSALDAVPAASVSWLLPAGVSVVSWSNFTSHNGSYSVREVFLLPACSPRELTAECVINHPAFEEPENRSVTLPLCARTNITINSSTEWREREQFTEVDCFAVSVAPAPVINWYIGSGDFGFTSNLSETQIQADGSVSVRSTVHLSSSLYAGQNVTCTVEHPISEMSERQTINIPAQKAPLLSVSVVRLQDSHNWMAVCESRGGGVGQILTWVLPKNTEDEESLHTETEGHSLKARLAYQFPLARHEGQDLTCVCRVTHGVTERRTVHIPKYYISAVRVVNHTTVLRDRYGCALNTRILSLRSQHHSQRILLEVDGNVPHYDLSCTRSDGVFVYTEGSAVVFQSGLTEEDQGLYTCRASFYHHGATVRIQVEVTSQDEQFGLVALICVSTASAIAIILVIILWVCCARNCRKQNKDHEYLSALTSLSQEPGSPEVRKPAVMRESDNPEIEMTRDTWL
ncbi:uncharacterized protein LOC103378048 isoform X2 [Cynoglossus semilaevis]|uniref:uncharacterized protein LOC103378048 isoform X2 n=1 Tax=Cynoglossus semilaevis TaxID=244447 RepID=UPI000D62AAC9|nr:uncharacterized protein LOC103378048 isoform X2 [Cynoglossus semilaevis]